MIVLGIDPGKKGGMALVSHEGTLAQSLWAKKMPDPDTERDIADMIQEAAATEGFAFAVLEKVNCNGMNGSKANWVLGGQYRAIRMALTLAGVTFYDVTPQRWMKRLDCMTGGDKGVSLGKAQQLFPNQRITKLTSDALLLAYYGRFIHQPEPVT